MANKEALNQQLLDMIRSMEQEGLVDFRFEMVYSLKETNGPFFFAELLPTFCSDSHITLRDLTIAMDRPVMDYHELEEFCMKIKGGTSCIGASRMALACGEFRQAVDNKSKEGCIMALNRIKNEFLILQEKMDAILELERRIIVHDDAVA